MQGYPEQQCFQSWEENSMSMIRAQAHQWWWNGIPLTQLSEQIKSISIIVLHVKYNVAWKKQATGQHIETETLCVDI